MAETDPDPGSAVVIMGVTGSGKSTIAKALAKALGCCYLDADDFHPEKNKEKMSKGIPLTDEDRIPWLEQLRDATNKLMESGKTVVLACSALRIKYREILRKADCHCEPGAYSTCKIKFVRLDAPMEMIAERMKRRCEDGSHFMPVSLLKSQFDLLEIDGCEGILKVDASSSVDSIVGTIIASFKM